LEVVYGEHGIAGSGEHRGDNNAHFGRISVFYHEVLGSKYVPCTVLFDLEPRVIGAVTEPPRRAALPGERRRLHKQRQRDVHTQERRHHHGGRERILHGVPQGGLHDVRGRRLRHQRLGLRTWLCAGVVKKTFDGAKTHF
jgi:hypothetical protein